MQLKALDKAIGCEGMDFVGNILRIVFIIKVSDFVLEPMFGFASTIIGILLATLLSRICFQKMYENLKRTVIVSNEMDTEKLNRTVELAKVLNQKSASMQKT